MTKNLFWTGGFDSTFRLLQLIHDSDITQINLYYISLVIDNLEISDIRRKSTQFEIDTMNLILQSIDTSKINNFNIIGQNNQLLHYSFQFNFPFMNYIQMDSIKYSDKNKVLFFDLFVDNIVHRPISQWGGITQILDDLNIDAEICLEKGGGIWSKIKNWVVDGKIDFDRYPPLRAFFRYQIPLVNLDRDEMVEISKDRNWSDILRLTWSCWYPKNGQECGKCFTCQRRPLL